MTAPENPMNPENLLPVVQAALGLGAYQIGGGTKNYGQEVEDDYVNTLIYGAIPKGNFDLMESVEDVTSYMQSFLATMPINILRYTKPFIAGATDDDYADSATAAAYITNALVPKSVVNTLSWLSRFMMDFTVLFDVLHATYPAGDPGDPPGQTSWYAAYNDLMELLNLTGGDAPTDGAPSWGTAVADAKAKWDSLMTQLAALPGLILGGGGVSPAEWATWWSTVLVDIGIGSTDAANIANWLSGNYDAAKQAKQWWDDFLTSLGIGSGTAAGGVIAGHGMSISDQQAWWNTFSTAFWVSLDLFHVFYPVGSPSDTPTTTSGGKMTWYASQAALKALFTTIGTTPPVVSHVDVGGTIVANADAVNQAITGASVTGADAGAVGTAVAGLQSTVAGLQSQVDALTAPAASPTTILSDTGQDSPGSGLGSNWTGSGTNAVNRDAGYGFNWATSGSSARTRLGIYNVNTLATNDQVATIVLNKLMLYNAFNPSNPKDIGAPYNQIILRANAASSPSSYVFARIWYDQVQFGYCASGTEHLFGSPTAFLATASSGYTFHAGDASSDYHYKLVSGGRTIASYDDSGAMLSSASLAGRYSGQSWTSTARTGGGEAYPASTSWRSWDASSSAGSPPNFGWVSRVSTTSVSLTSGFPTAGFFDTPVQLGANISQPGSGQDGFIVAEAGIYAVSFAIRTSNTTGNDKVKPRLAVNGTIVESGSLVETPSGVSQPSGLSMAMASAGVSMAAGDRVSPVLSIPTLPSGWTGIGGTLYNGSADGSETFMKIMKIG